MSFSWLPPPVLVAGPGALENEDLNLTVAETLAEFQAKLGLRVLFKESFNKANRSNLDAPRDPELEWGLARLAWVRTKTGLRVLADVHEVH